MLLRLCGALHATPDQLLYPPEKQTGFRPAGIVSAGLFQKIAAAVFVLGFVLGVSAGSEAYAPAPDTVGWHSFSGMRSPGGPAPSSAGWPSWGSRGSFPCSPPTGRPPPKREPDESARKEKAPAARQVLLGAG